MSQLVLNEALRSCCGKPSRECRCCEGVANVTVDHDDVLPIPAIDYTQPSGLTRRVLPQPTINRQDAPIGGFAAEWAAAEQWVAPTLNARTPAPPAVDEDPLPLPEPLVTNEMRQEMERRLRR